MQKVKYFLSWLFISIRCDLGLICCWHSFVWLDLRIFVHPNCANEIVTMSSVTMWCTMATLHILKHSWFFLHTHYSFICSVYSVCCKHRWLFNQTASSCNVLHLKLLHHSDALWDRLNESNTWSHERFSTF